MRLEQEAAFVKRLPHQPDIQAFEIPQPPVDQFAGAARSAGGEVALLDEGDRETAARGVESDAAPGHAAADDHDVEHLSGQAGERAPAALLRGRRDGQIAISQGVPLLRHWYVP